MLALLLSLNHLCLLLIATRCKSLILSFFLLLLCDSYQEFLKCHSKLHVGIVQCNSYCSRDIFFCRGQFGMMQFDRQKLIPLEKFMMVNSVFEQAPTNRLILPIFFFSAHPYFTSESAKQWIWAGYLQVHFTNKLKLSVSGAFVDGNVGVM